MGKTWLGCRISAGTVAAIALVVCSIGGVQAAAPAAGNNVLIMPEVVSNLWVNALDPAQVSDLQSITLSDLVYSGLVKLDGNNNVVPDLAAKLPAVSSDRLTYTFTLRSSAAFSDGTPVTAQDVAYTLSRALSKQEASPAAMTYLGHIKGAAAWNAGKASSLAGVKAVDARTVQITLDRPVGFFLQSLVYPTSFVVKQTVAAGEDLVGQNAQSRNIGTGPWMFSRTWRYRQEMYLTRNPHWYDSSRLKIDEIDIPMISNVDLAYREYLSGQIPVAAVPSAYLPTVKNDSDFHASPLLTIDYIAPNTGKDSLCKPTSCAPFNDVHFRRAMMFAIDRTTITQKILHGSMAPLCGLIPKGMSGYDPSLCSLTPYDPARAKSELAMAMKDFHGKLPNEGHLTLIYQALGQDYANEYTEVQSELAAVGININIQATPLNNWINLTGANYTPLMEDQWSADYVDAQDYAENLLGSSSPYNVGNYDNPTFERLLTQADVTPNGSARTAMYVQAQRIAMQDAAFIMIGQLQGAYRWKSNLRGFFISSAYTFQPANLDWTNASVS